MRKAAGLTVVVAALLAGIISGIFAHRASGGSTLSDREKLTSIAALGEDVYRQYRSGNGAGAKAALLAHIQLLERADAESDQPHNNPYAVDAVISYVRLAKLEEKNNREGKAGYMREASIRCERLRLTWGDCSDEVLRRFVDKMDTITLR